MSKLIDLTGLIFKNWKVIKRSDYKSPKYNAVFWDCKCEMCDNEKILNGTMLKRNGISGCQCHNTRDKGLENKKTIDLTGSKLEYLTVLSIDSERSLDHVIYWKCLCKCGEEISVASSDLRRGRTKSCGCHQPFHIKNLIGKKFNNLTIISEGKTRKPQGKQKGRKTVICKCDCGKEKEFLKSNVTKGQVRTCGCYYYQKDVNGHSTVRKKKRKNKGGYIEIYAPDHPNARDHGYVLEHKFVMSQHIGRKIEDYETIHHTNGKRDDNRLENLELWASKHPPGQRIEDLVKHAKFILKKYDNYQNPTKLYFSYQIVTPTNIYTGNSFSNNKGNTITVSSLI